MSLRARLIVEGYIIGHHRSPYHGFSVEFAEHKAYGVGDEVRHIDWRLYGKTDRLYVKRYQEETNLRANIILDTSKSMIYKSGKVSKLEYANLLTAALSYLMIHQQDAAGLIKFSDKINSHIQPKSRPSHLNIIMNNLNDIETGNDTKIELVLHEIKNSGYHNKLIGGVVLTGGGSQLKHLSQLVEYHTGIQSRVGYPNEHLASNSPVDVSSPMFATGVGLVIKGLEFNNELEVKMKGTKVTSSSSLGDFFGGLLDKIDDFLGNDIK